MSLKAKIEAVIYASEEPVTLAQLISLLGEEGQAELDTLDSNQLSLEPGDDAEIFAQNELAELEDENAAALEHEAPAEDDGPADPDALNAEVFDTSEVTTTEPVTPQGSVILSEGSEPHTEPQSKDPDASEATTEVEPLSATELAAEPAPNTKALAAADKLRARKLREHFRLLLDQLIADYANNDRGLEIREVASGFRLATKPEYHDAVRGFVKSLKPPLKLSLQALETLAVVAYKQPITAPEVTEIRGVDSAGTLGSLLTRKLVTTAGRKQVIGRPILYKTTKDFLLRFGLKDINELPSIEEFERMAGELNEAVQEEIQMEEHAAHEAALAEDERETGGSPPLDELHAVPEATTPFHETTEDLLSDKSTHPEGHKHESE